MVQKNSLKNKILIICGPTASGKSSLAVKCAKLLDSEVISADSMNIYQQLNIGTAKPSIDEMDGIKHHMIDIVSPFDSFTVSDYQSHAREIIDKLLILGKVPVICGGTGFYINSILYNLSYGNGQADLNIRKKYFDLATQFGNEYVYNILIEKDFKSAEKLHYNDIKRVIRALEIYETGVKKSDIKDNFLPVYDYDAYSFNYDRNVLYNRIDTRVDKMIELGLVDEVKHLIDIGVSNKNQCMQGIGYKEIYSYLFNELSFNETIDLIKLNTRHYAKRQITFFKKLNNLKYIEPNNLDTIAERIVKDL